MTDITDKNNTTLKQFGFRFERGGVHTARTMMLEDLDVLLSYMDNPEAAKTDYLHAIDQENCLGKRSGKTRKLTFQHLVELYSLNHSVLLYRTLVFFWHRDVSGRPLLALLCAYARDSILRSTAPFILQHPEGKRITREAVESFIDDMEPGRFSKATLKSTAQNINSTMTKAGYLTGRTRKFRTRAVPGAGSASYALLLGYLAGARGKYLFQTEYMKLLDCSIDRAIELAEDATRKGWIVFKRIGDVMEVMFPKLITDQEMEWLREQD